MTTRLKTSLAAGLVALSVAAAAPAVFGQDAAGTEQQQRRRGPAVGGPMRGAPGFGGPEFRGLDLSEDQRAQLRKIRDARQAEFRAAGEKLRTARDGMRALLTADTIDESAIRAKSVEVAAAEADVAILNARVRAESMQVLTAEQQQKLKEQRQSRGARRPRGV